MKKTLALVAALLLTLVITACEAVVADEEPFKIYGYDGEFSEEIVLQNEFLELHFNPETTAFNVVDKNKGNIWYSNPQDLESDALATPVNKRLMNSQFYLTYSNDAGNTGILDSSSFSVEKGLYEIDVLDNSIEVHYTLGNIERVYYIPTAVPESRMVEFTSKMEKSEVRKIEEYYRKLDINKLRATDDSATIIANYPDIVNEPVYELRDTVQPFLKIQIEEIFEKYGYTTEDYELDAARYNINKQKETAIFNVTIRYELDGDNFKVTVPYDNIEYVDAFPIVELNILPYFAAAGLEDEGYMFVPDGSGGLITFNNGRYNQTAYTNSVYGWDEGLYREAIISDNKALYPVFGVYKNEQTMMCIIEEGAPYANIKADVSGRGTSYNNVFVNYAMIHKETLDISSKSDKTVLIFEKGLPAGENIVQKYVFCDEAGYVGMAKTYREYLMSNYGMEKNTEAEVPVAVEIVGAVNKTQHILGLPFDLPLKLTSYKEAEEIVNGLTESGFDNVNYLMTGWFNNSVQHTVPSSINLISKLGGKKELINLAKAASSEDNEFYLEANFLYMTDNSIFDSFNLNSDAARYINRERIENYPYSFVWYGERDNWGKLSYLARPAYMMEIIDNYVKTIKNKFDVNNVAFRTIGNNLAGDYNEKRLVSREASMNIQAEKLKELKAQGTGVMINTGYAYAVPYADFIRDIPMTYQGFLIVDTEVPFYQIAIHGLVSYTGRPINLGEDYSLNILRTMETGSGLSFSLMTEEASVLQETKFHKYYANEYDKWSDTIAEIYNKFKSEYSGIYNQFIQNHTILANNITLTEYENGFKVLVNKSVTDYNYNGTTIKSMDYLIIEEGR